VELVDLELPEPRPGEVRVAIEGCGVCGSNVPVWEGRPWFTYPLAPGAPGHEAWGRVEAVQDRHGQLRVGTPVALLSTQAFATAAVVPAAEVVALPDELGGRHFPGEALGCGFNVARRAAVRADETVAVIGIGFIGSIVTQLAAHTGARVIAIARRPESLELARRLGASETVLMDDHQRILGEVEELTGGQWCNTVVEAVGLQWPLDLAGQLTGFGGTLVIAGYHQDGPRSVDVQLWNWRGIDVINAHERDPARVRRGVREAAHAVLAGWLDPEPLYSHVYPFAQLDRALDALVERPVGLTKALVTT
jgi:threonine dehydrogenase-like Zn-dependent dehydrogenase